MNQLFVEKGKKKKFELRNISYSFLVFKYEPILTVKVHNFSILQHVPGQEYEDYHCGVSSTVFEEQS